MPPFDPPDSDARIAALEARIAALESTVADLSSALAARTPAIAAPQLAPRDAETLRQLLPRIAERWGSAPFRTRDLLDAGLAQGSPERVGQLLKRAIDIPVGRYCIARGKTELGARLWVVLLAPR